MRRKSQEGRRAKRRMRGGRYYKRISCEDGRKERRKEERKEDRKLESNEIKYQKTRKVRRKRNEAHRLYNQCVLRYKKNKL